MAALSFSVRAGGLPPVLPVALAASRSARVYLHRCLLWFEARQIQNPPQCHLGLLRKALRPSKGSIWLSSTHTRAYSDGLPPKSTCSDTAASARLRFTKWCSPSNQQGWFDDNPELLAASKCCLLPRVDTGCRIKAFHQRVIDAFIPMQTLYSFIPALAVSAGFTIRQVPVRHRPRRGGKSKYGVRQFLWKSLLDMVGVWWFARRRCPLATEKSGKTAHKNNV